MMPSARAPGMAAVAAACALAMPAAAPASTGTALPAATWPMYQFRSDHQAVFASPAWRLAWSHHLAKRINGGLSVVGTTLYVESFDKRLTALDARTGDELWHAELPNIAMNTPLVAEGRVFVGTGDSDPLVDTADRYVIGRPEGDAILAFDAASGSELWRTTTVGENMPTGVYVAQPRAQLIVSSGDDAVRAIDPATGRVLWQRPTVGAATMSSLAFDGDRVYGLSLMGFGYLSDAYRDAAKYRYSNRSWALRPDGQYVWTQPYGNADCSPTVGDGTVFVEQDVRSHLDDANSREGWTMVYALDARTGSVRWSYSGGRGTWSADGSKETSIAGVFADRSFYESLPFSRQYVAFDASTGTVRWSVATHGPVKMSGLSRAGKIYVGDTAGWFYVIDAARGDVLQRVRFPQIFTAAPPVIVGTTLFVPNDTTIDALPIGSDGTISTSSIGAAP